MTVFEIVLIALAVILLVFVGGGMLVAARAARAREAALRAKIEAADHALADAHAEDNGWEPAEMEAAVRAHVGDGRGAVAELDLVQVVDRPGTEDDEAVYRVVDADGRAHEVRLRRTAGGWVA